MLDKLGGFRIADQRIALGVLIDGQHAIGLPLFVGDETDALAFQGRLATVGYLDGVLKAEIDIEALHGKRLALFGVSNKLRNAEQRAVTVRGMVADVLPAIADGRIRPLIDRVYAFDDLPAAKAYMESNAHLGKIVVRMPDAVAQ